MKVISIPQPWAIMVVTGIKKIETRGWETDYRGPLLIHATNTGKVEIPAQLLNKIIHTINDHDVPKIKETSGLPFNTIIGKVNLCGIEPVHHMPQGKILSALTDGILKSWEVSLSEIAFGDFTKGRYGWLLSDPVRFSKPIPSKGSSGIWDFNEQICMHCGYIDNEQKEFILKKEDLSLNRLEENICKACKK